MSTFDIAIVGGGLIGVSAAFELSGAGLSVVVFDRQEPGRESSWAAAGMLAPGPDSPRAAALVPLAKESLGIYPQFVSAVEESAGKPTSFAREGTLEIFAGPSAEIAREKFLAEYRRHGLAVEAISVEAARKIENTLNASAAAVAWIPDEAMIDPRLLVEAVISAAKNRGAQIRANCGVASLLNEAGRCAGVVAGGERISTKHVLITAGCYSGQMEDEIARHAATRPVRGQMMALKHRDVRLTHVLRSEKGYLVPRPDGRIMVGSTLEEAGFEKGVTQEGLQKIRSAAVELVPQLVNAEVVETWSGLRPGTPDDLPILGPTDTEGLLVATGHYRNGILLAPITAKLVREWIVSGRSSVNVEPFSPLRFQNSRSYPATRG